MASNTEDWVTPFDAPISPSTDREFWHPCAEVAEWEGAGGRPCESPAHLAEADLARAIERQNARIVACERGAQIADAITMLHGQRKPDGRPLLYIPEECA